LSYCSPDDPPRTVGSRRWQSAAPFAIMRGGRNLAKPTERLAVKFRHRLTWMDVDYARVAFYLRYYVWVDEAFHGHLCDRGFRLKDFLDAGYGLPFLKNSCRYMRPLTLEDEIDIDIEVAALEEKGFTLKFRIHKVGDTAPAAEGEAVRRCIQINPLKSTALPPELRSILEDMGAPKI
jgi:YbgC/YbaW family acyl-CoA thioester hydrolase